MSEKTNEINKITGTIISISVRLIIYALVALLLYQGVTKGFAFGYEIFHSSAVAAPPGSDKSVTIKTDSVSAAGKLLKNTGLIANEYIFAIQAKFYDYEINPGTYVLNTSMTSKDMLKLLNEEPVKEEEKE